MYINNYPQVPVNNYGANLNYQGINNYGTMPVTVPFLMQNYNIKNFSYPAQYYIQTPQTNMGTQSPYGAWRLTEISKTPYGDNVYKYTLKNGQTVVLVPKKDASTIIKTFVDAGSMNENDKNRGISHFNEHNLFNGSKNLEPGRFFKETAKLGADTNASTDYAQTDFYIMSPVVDNKSLKQIIEMHSDMLVNPLFPNDMVEKEKGPVTSEISMCNDNTANKAINTLIKNLFQINTESEDLVAGSIETVNNITRDDVYNHWKKHFTPDNMYTVLVGDFNPNEAIELISRNFTTPPVQNPEQYRTKEVLTPIQQSTRADYISPNENSTNVFCAFTGPENNNFKDKIAFTALSNLLFQYGIGRLSKELDAMRAFGGDCAAQKIGLNDNDPEALIFQFSTKGGDDSKVLDKFYEVIKSFETKPITNEEMKIVKNYMLKSLALSFEDSESITDTIGRTLLDNSLRGVSQYKTIIENLTPQDIMNVVYKYLDFNKMSVAVVHPHNMTEETIQNNYKNSTYSKKQNPVSFKGSMPSAGDVKSITLKDNTAVSLNNHKSDNCYLDWRLTCKEVIPENPACSYILTQILNDGSRNKSKEEFAYDASLNSVSYDTTANSFQIRTCADCLYGNTKDAINTMKEMIYNPRFTQEDFDAAVKKVETYCSALDKDASTNLLAELYGKYFPSPKQILEGLKTLTLDDVKRHYNNLIFNSSSNLVVSAPFEKHPELEQTITQKFNTSNVNFKLFTPRVMESYAPNNKEVVLLDTEKRNQAQIFKNYSFKMPNNVEGEIKFEILNTILGGSPSSRLFQDLREKQKLAYSVSSDIQSFENSGIMTLRILTTTDDKEQNDIKYDNLKKSLDGFKAHTDKLMNEYVTDEELKSAKMQLKQDTARIMNTPYGMIDFLSMNMTQPNGIKRIDEYINAIDKITKEDIKQAANEVFATKPIYSILASPDTINNQIDYINSLGEVVKL